MISRWTDEKLLRTLGQTLVQISVARKVGNTYMVDTGEQTKRNILRECEKRGITTEGEATCG